MDGRQMMVRRFSCCILLASVWIAGILIAGCATSTGHVVECPLTATQQQQAIQEIVPLGTPREQAAERLTKAGIEFTTAAGDSMYYCSTWKRSDGTRWHLNVAMLFDQENKLYRLREADTVAFRETGKSTDGSGGQPQWRSWQSDQMRGARDAADTTTDEPIRSAFPGRVETTR